MKQLFTLLIMLLSIFTLKAQTETSQNFNKEFGINATNFINLFLSFNDNFVGTNNYLLTDKKFKDDGKVLRLGGSIRGNSFVDDPDDDNSNFDKRTTNLFDLDFRVGSEKQIPVKGQWSVNFGADAIAGYFFSSSKTDDNKLTLNSIYLGGGPVAGIQYMINDRIGLLTEASFYLTLSTALSKSSNGGSSSEDSKDKETQLGFGTSLPSNLIFFGRF